MTVRTWVGQFGIVQGQALEAGPWQGRFGLRPAGDEPIDLYVLAQPALPGSEEFCGQLVAVVGHLFERQNLSVTGALTKAIGAAHDNLRDWNRKSLREHQVGAGICCLVVRGTVAYLAQAGPSLAYYRNAAGLRRLVPEDPRATAVLGLADDLRPELKRFDLAAGDLLLVASPSLDDIADGAAVERLLSLDAEEALSELYLLARDQPDFSVFILSCFEPDTDAEQTRGLRGEPVPPPDVPPRPAAPAPTPTPAPVSNPSPAPNAEPELPLFTPQPPQPPEDDTEASFRLLPQLELASVAVAAPDMSRQTVRLRGSQPSLRRHAPSPVAGITKSIPSWVLPVALIVGIVALLAWWVIPGSMAGNRQAKFDSLLTGAKDAYSASLSLSDLSQKRATLEDADNKAAEAADMQPDNSEAATLKGNITAALDEMNAVSGLAGLRLVTDLKTQLTGDISLQQLVVGGGRAYLLDRKENRVVSVSLGAPEGETKELFREGDLVGMVKAARPSQITWLPDVDGGSLLVLDSDRHLFSFRSDGEGRPLALNGADSWGSLDGAAAAAGSLYILDKKGGQVWRYASSNGAFTGNPEGLLSGVDLSSASGIAVNGDVYLLLQNGGIRRFSGGEEVSFETKGIDRPLASPAALTPLSDGGMLVVDRSNKRVVLLAPDGSFQSQFVSSQIANPQALAVDEVAGRLYLLNGDSLYVATLPVSSTGSNDQLPAGEPTATATAGPDLNP